ncbi:phage tail sheath family protein [Fructilactobacillus vespulae]|uniref:phage tail sheath family protein n=1 Tax=Fructilactobacillus vespulae TaxID=1249630 RepID=UPI0039B41CE2
MAGGTYNSQNKMLPGAWVNVRTTQDTASTNTGERGVVFTALTDLGWGENGLVNITAGSDILSKLGVDLDSPKITGLRMVLGNAKKALVFNANSGTKATGISDNLPFDISAKYNGKRGNDITVTVSPDSNNATNFTVETLLGTKLVDKQRISKVSDYQANSFVEFAIKGSAQSDDGVSALAKLTNPVSVKLSGGDNTKSLSLVEDISNAIETSDFNTIVAADSADNSPLHAVFVSAAERLRDEQGKKVQAVVPDKANTKSDYEGVIVVGNSIVMSNGTELTQSQSAGFVAGASAAALPNESLTYRQINGAKDVSPRLNDDDSVDAISQGKLIFTASRGTVKVLQDINSLHTFSDGKGHDFAKNRSLRVLDAIANTVRITWEDSFIGKVTNNADGRDLFKSVLVNYLTTLQNMNAIQSFKPDDVVVNATENKDSVSVDVAVTTTDSLEKMYMTITSR